MANYNTRTKILIVDSNDSRADSATGSAAKAINDFIETLDDTTNQILFIIEAPISNTQSKVTIIYKG